MKKVKRLVSFRKPKSAINEAHDEFESVENSENSSPTNRVVKFELGWSDASVRKRESPFKRPNLQRTKSRSVEYLKATEGSKQPSLYRRSILKSHNKAAENGGSGRNSDSDSSVFGIDWSNIPSSSMSRFASPNRGRSQSYYKVGSQKNSPLATPSDSSGNFRSPSFYRKTMSKNMARCGSTPPVGTISTSIQRNKHSRSSMSNIYGLNKGGSEVAMDHLSYRSLNLLPSPIIQSEEDLILDQQRKHEKTMMNQSRMREETSILKNIKKREYIEMKKKNEIKVIPQSTMEPSKPRKGNKKSPIPLNLLPSSSASQKQANPETKNRGELKNIASGLMGTRTILLAPTAAALIDPNVAKKKKNTPAKISENIELMEKWVPPPIQNPKERNLVRRFLTSFMNLDHNGASVTKFVESNFTQECLQWHNYYRAIHDSPPLILDEQLCASAQYWANILAHRDEFFYENPPDLGENILAWPLPVMAPDSLQPKMMPDISGRDVACYWYKTIRNYYFLKNPEVLHAYGAHFSQMIWYSSQKFGCGKARSKSGKLLVVAHYFPKGNIVGEFHENVLPAKESTEDDNNDPNRITRSLSAQRN